MTAAYATLASSGVSRRPTGIAELATGDGEVLQELEPGGRRAISEATATQVTDILRDVVSYGTGTRARIPGVAVAGKTGTAEDHADAWFCGSTTRVASCVRIGYPESRVPMRNVHGISVTGGSLPAEIWRAFMSNTAGGSSFSEPAPSGASGTSSYSPPPDILPSPG